MATAFSDISARFLARMASASGALRDNNVVDAILKIVLNNTVAPRVARATGTLAGSGTANVDLRGGLTLIDGTATESIATMYAYMLRITNPATGQILKMGIGAANGMTTLVDLASAAIVVGGGIAGGQGPWLMGYNPAGWATTAGTADILVLTNSGTVSLDYEFVMVGI